MKYTDTKFRIEVENEDEKEWIRRKERMDTEIKVGK